MRQRSRIWDVILFTFMGLVLFATVYAALQPTSLEEYNPQDSGTGLRLKMNRNQERIQFVTNSQRIAIDTNAVQRFEVVVNDVDTVTLPQPYTDDDFQICPWPMVWYGTAPTSFGLTAVALTDSTFVIDMGGTDDSVRIQVITAGCMLGRE